MTDLTESEQRVLIAARPVIDEWFCTNCGTSGSNVEITEPTIDTDALLAALREHTRAAVLGELELGERCREGGLHDWRRDSGADGNLEPIRVCAKCKSSRKVPLLWHEQRIAELRAEGGAGGTA